VALARAPNGLGLTLTEPGTPLAERGSCAPSHGDYVGLCQREKKKMEPFTYVHCWTCLVSYCLQIIPLDVPSKDVPYIPDLSCAGLGADDAFAVGGFWGFIFVPVLPSTCST